MLATKTETNVSCYGGTTGSVTVSATPGTGTAPYEYSIDGEISWQAFGTFNGLAAGSYTVIVRDAANCKINVPVNITQPSAALAATISAQTNVLCYGNSTGTATANPTGGTGPYTYSWNTSPVQNTKTATGLAAGTYIVTVTDANLCTVPASVTISQPAAALTVTTDQVNVLCYGQKTGTATANPSGGTGVYTYSWNTTPVQYSKTATGLGAGTYTVTVTDANSCSIPSTVTITQPAAALVVTTTQVNVLCYGNTTGTATANPSGGTAPYNYSWNTIPVQTTQTINGLAAGNYTVIVTDANGCSAFTTVTITQPASAITASASSNTPVCEGSTLNLNATASGGNGSLTYSWTGPNRFTSTPAKSIHNQCNPCSIRYL